MEVSKEFTPGQHNFVVVYPKGYQVRTPPAADSVIRIIDPWLFLYPGVYTTSTYRKVTGSPTNLYQGYSVDCVGKDDSDCLEKRKKKTEEYRRRLRERNRGLDAYRRWGHF